MTASNVPPSPAKTVAMGGPHQLVASLAPAARGIVIAVGQGKSDDTGKRTPLDVKAGDKVLFGKYSGTEIKLDGEDHMILREEEILAVLEG